MHYDTDRPNRHEKMNIKTQRLALRPLSLNDLATVHKYSSDSENTKYMIRLPNETLEETREFLTNAEAEWKKANPSFYEFAVILDNVQIGGIGLYIDETGANAEIGWILDKAYHNNGYITEAAFAVIEFAKENLHLRKIVAQCDSRNAASEKVMKKLGMTLYDGNGTRTYIKRDETAKELTYILLLCE